MKKILKIGKRIELYVTCYQITIKLHSKAKEKPLSCLPFIIFTFDCAERARKDDADEKFSAANHANSLFLRSLCHGCEGQDSPEYLPFYAVVLCFVQSLLSHSLQPLNLILVLH